MKTVIVRGIVINEYEAGESDKRLLILCKTHGRIMAYARGARKPKSKFMAASQIFTYADFVLAEGRGFYSVTQADVIESFYNLRTDYDRLNAAHLAAEICTKSLQDSINCDELLLLLIKTFSHLKKESLPSIQIALVFFMRFFLFYGLAPQTENCTVCETPFEQIEKLFFCPEGVVCKNYKNNTIAVSKTAVYAINHILMSDLKEAFLFKISDEVMLELWRVASLMWNYHFEHPLKTCLV